MNISALNQLNGAFNSAAVNNAKAKSHFLSVDDVIASIKALGVDSVAVSTFNNGPFSDQGFRDAMRTTGVHVAVSPEVLEKMAADPLVKNSVLSTIKNDIQSVAKHGSPVQGITIGHNSNGDCLQAISATGGEIVCTSYTVGEQTPPSVNPFLSPLRLNNDTIRSIRMAELARENRQSREVTIAEREQAKLQRIAENFGLDLISDAWRSSLETGGTLAAMFSCPNTGAHKIFKVFEDGSSLMTSVPSSFNANDFHFFMKIEFPRLMEKLDLTDIHAGSIAERVKQAFDEFFQEKFPGGESSTEIADI